MGAVLDLDLVVDQGVDWPGPVDVGGNITWKVGTTAADAVLVDLTGYTAAMKIRALAGGSVLLSLTSGAGITLGGTAGTILINITAAQAAALPAGLHQYDVLLTDGAGRITKFHTGSLRVNPTMSGA